MGAVDCFEAAPSLPFSQCQWSSVQSGEPPCVMSPLLSAEKAMHANSRVAKFAAAADSTFFRFRVATSYTVAVAGSPSGASSATATSFRFGETAIAVIPSDLSVHGMNRCSF